MAETATVRSLAALPSEWLGGRHALVTGAGRGIGRAAALALAQLGARVTLVARTASELREVAAEIGASGGVALVAPADVTDETEVERVVGSAESTAPLSICVNAAGLNRTGASVDYALEDWELLMAVNVRGTFLVARAVARRLLARGGAGAIVNVSSQMGAVGYPGRAAYCASKHAVNGLTKAMAVEWARSRITVNAVAPTFLRTPLTEPMLADAEFRADVEARLPAGQVGEVGDVVGAIAYLAGDRARLVTGHVLAVDGGWTAW